MKKTIAIFSAAFCINVAIGQNNIGVGTNSPDASAKLDVTSTTQGMLTPRMTKAQRDVIVSPATGLLIYQTDNTPGFYFYNGSAWVAVSGSSFVAASVYGDGSAGALTVASGNTLDLSTLTGINSLAGGRNFQFSSITINGTLIVPSGTKLRCTGAVTISGTITVNTGTADNGSFRPHPGIGASGASTVNGGLAISNAVSNNFINLTPYGGGAGARTLVAGGGEGGGSFQILALGNITVNGSGLIRANGNSGTNPNTAGSGIVGAGGGAGGVICLLSKGTIAVSGTIQATGGNGSAGFDGNGGNAEGGGGGGGGGLIYLVATVSPSITGIVTTAGGNPGANAGVSPTINSGGGGGASAGSGGNGGATTSTPSSGTLGQTVTIVAANPENL